MNLLDKLVNLEDATTEFGFQWNNTAQIMQQIENECAEVQEHLLTTVQTRNSEALQEEIGDLLHAVLSLCVFCKLSPQETLATSLEKFERRFNSVKAQAQEQGFLDLKGHSFETLMQFWDRAKQLVG